MEPLSPNDPLHTLLGKAKAVEPRPNFTQNVMRAIRQVPQTQGFWERLQQALAGLTMPRLAFAAAAAFVLAALGGLTVWKSSSSPDGAALAQAPVAPPAPVADPVDATIPAVDDPMDFAMASELEAVDALSVLLAQQDTSALTDSEIALLLY